MLVLTRKVQEQIQIGDHVTITVLQVKGGQVRIGIDAPKSVRIVRSELSRFEDEPRTTTSEQRSSQAVDRLATRSISSPAPARDFSSPSEPACREKRETVNRVADALRRNGLQSQRAESVRPAPSRSLEALRSLIAGAHR